jgi:uncharacterized protein (DUF58 family)
MSYRGSPTRRNIGKFFPLTRWGALFSLLSLTILVIGALRMELAAILWGSAFTLLALYSLLANRITQALLGRYFDKSPDPVDFTLSSAGVFPGGEVAAQLKAELPGFIPPGIRVRAEILLHWVGRDPLTLESDLRGGRNSRVFAVSPSFRGLYQSREIRMVVGDILGFTRHPLLLDLTEKLRVFPAVQPEAARRPPSLGGGGEERTKRRLRRSEELLEVRKYFPGDDIRKVNWKVFAHTSELFLRIGEETPPPESRFLVILDTAPTGAVPQRIGADYLDSLVEACAATVLELTGKGFHVFFGRCDSSRLMRVTTENKMQLLGELAGVWWNDRYALELQLQRLHQILLFSSPGSPNLPRLSDDLRKRGSEVLPFFPDLPVSSEQPKSGWLRNLVLSTPADRSGGYSPLSEGELADYHSRAEWERARWSRRETGKVVG